MTMHSNQPTSVRRPFARRITRATAIAAALYAHSMIAQPASTNSAVRPASTVTGRNPDDEIRFAVLPLPEKLRDGATVMRMDSTHRPVIVRQGTNNMVCMRVVPGEADWDARCYDAAITRLILRAGELMMSGLTIDSVGARIQAEARAGTLKLPAQPSAGYRVLGPKDAYNPVSGAVTPQMQFWQSLHVPFATAEGMGLPDESAVPDTQRGRMPYVMASGTWWAHVMIEHGNAN